MRLAVTDEQIVKWNDVEKYWWSKCLYKDLLAVVLMSLHAKKKCV